MKGLTERWTRDYIYRRYERKLKDIWEVRTKRLNLGVSFVCRPIRRAFLINDYPRKWSLARAAFVRRLPSAR